MVQQFLNNMDFGTAGKEEQNEGCASMDICTFLLDASAVDYGYADRHHSDSDSCLDYL
jgi:hypothetical protein